MLTLSVAWSCCWSAKHTSNINIRANLSTLAEIAIRSIVIVTIKPNMSIVLRYLSKPRPCSSLALFNRLTLLSSTPIEVTIHLVMIISVLTGDKSALWWLDNESVLGSHTFNRRYNHDKLCLSYIDDAKSRSFEIIEPIGFWLTNFKSYCVTESSTSVYISN